MVQEKQLAKQKTHQSDVEYKLFMQYYSKLSGIPSLVELTPYFVAANIITSSDGESIINTAITESPTAALRKLLNTIFLILIHGHSDDKVFGKILSIMKIHGDGPAQLLATEIEPQSPVKITSVNIGAYVRMYVAIAIFKLGKVTCVYIRM